MSGAKTRGCKAGQAKPKGFGVGNANASTFWVDGQPVTCSRLRVSLPTATTHRKLMQYVGLTGLTPSQVLASIIDNMPDPELVMHSHPAGMAALIDALKR